MDVNLSPAPPAVPATATTTTTALASAQLTPSKKRTYDGEIVTHSPGQLLQQPSSPLTVGLSIAGSPQFSEQSTPLTDLGATPPPPISPSTTQHQDADMAPKKPKLTFAEKQAQQLIKEAEKAEKERAKTEAKAKKEEDKAKKDEWKKRKDEEREAARRERDAKKAVKDAEKQAKEAEKERLRLEAEKKAKAQPRIKNFFVKPTSASTPPLSDHCDLSRGTTPTRRNSITSIDMDESMEDVGPSPSKPINPEYSKWILPFFVGDHMEVAPSNRFHQNRAFYDGRLPLNEDVVPEKLNPRFYRRRRTHQVKSVKKIMTVYSGSEDAPIDLANSSSVFTGIPYKYLFYKEDVRPAYQGTYTRVVSPRKARRLAVEPSYRGLPDTDYDYDSEAEWQEPEEGDEEVLDDDEQSEDEGGDEEMDDFLDDEGDLLKRQQVDANMLPVSSGICWEGTSTPENGWNFQQLRMQPLHDSTTFPIDPYSTIHWTDLSKKIPAKREEKSPQPTAMQPPRLPLMAVDPNTGGLAPPPIQNPASSSSTQSENPTPSTKANGKATTSTKPIKLVPPELLMSFKAAIDGSDLSKVGLVEVLNAKFKECSKAMIKNTLEAVAERKGPKRGEERWALIA